MRLLNTVTKRLDLVVDEKQKRYAILSHTWEGHEPTYQDFLANPTPILQTAKVSGLIIQAQSRTPPIEYVWVDTICIDKSSSAELQEAINSMYKWYERAAICFAYLADVAVDAEAMGDSGLNPMEQAIRKSRWFTRGWTLQELVAPRVVHFHDASWRIIGAKVKQAIAHGVTRQPADLVPLIGEITNIPTGVLYGMVEMQAYSVGQRMSWAAARRTTREEDRAYSLMGLFGVNMPMLYGEGGAAFLRLQDEIMKRTDDHTLFAYNYHATPNLKEYTIFDRVLPLTPANYAGCAQVDRLTFFPEMIESTGNESTAAQPAHEPWSRSMEHHMMTNKGLYIELDVLEIPKLPGTVVGRLNCVVKKGNQAAPGLESRVVVVPLNRLSALPGSKLFLRTTGAPLVDLPLRLFSKRAVARPMYITTDPLAAGNSQQQCDTPQLNITSIGHRLTVSEMYPAFSYTGSSWRLFCTFPTRTSMPERIYIRFRSQEHGWSFLVQVHRLYDEIRQRHEVGCDVLDIPANRSLLELLVLDEFRKPFRAEQAAVLGSKIVYKYRLPGGPAGDINSVDVIVYVLNDNSIDLTLRSSDVF